MLGNMKKELDSVGGKDVFVVLPTGFGKSLIYASMPRAFDILHATHDSVVVVITPLTAIMKDQVILPKLLNCGGSIMIHDFLGC